MNDNATQAQAPDTQNEVTFVIDVRGGCVQSVYGDAAPQGLKLNFLIRDWDNIEAGDPDPITKDYTPAAVYL